MKREVDETVGGLSTIRRSPQRRPCGAISDAAILVAWEAGRTWSPFTTALRDRVAWSFHYGSIARPASAGLPLVELLRHGVFQLTPGLRVVGRDVFRQLH